ncbi:hypothetical protein ACTQ5K_00685 [Niallia sp. Sow4_A1]|uniref:hypothetical protein n=1 Tax=Niallia sp. Sow4_A1 TaxID=3438793 RepID=UPI003F980959
MDKNIKEYKEFLEDELKRSKEHSTILDEINIKLHEMREIAEYALNNNLTKEETNRLNSRLIALKEEIIELEKGLFYIVQ